MPHTTKTFTDLYGIPPQEFFARTVHADAAGTNIALWEKEIAKAQVELDAIPDPQSISPSGDAIDPATGLRVEPMLEGYTHLGALQKSFELETLIHARQGDIRTAKFRQAGARAFLTGEIADYLPFVTGGGSELQLLIAAGLVDTTIVPEA